MKTVPRAKVAFVDSYIDHQDTSSVMLQHSGEAGFPRRPPAPLSSSDDGQRFGWQRAADGVIEIPGQGAGGCKRSGGPGEIGENDLEIELAAAAGDIRLRGQRAIS